MFSEKWHKRFMEVAELVATWSKDPSTKTGAIVVGPDREIRATGYNGLVRGVDDNKPERMERPTKYDFFEHAERNAIYNACLTGTSLKGCVMYATHAPCTDCARAIIQSGIKMVVTHEVNNPVIFKTAYFELCHFYETPHFKSLIGHIIYNPEIN